MREVDESEDAEDERQPDRAERKVVAGDDAVDRHLPELPPSLGHAQDESGPREQNQHDETRPAPHTIHERRAGWFGGDDGRL